MWLKFVAAFIYIVTNSPICSYEFLEDCPREWLQGAVCGTDDQTYPNKCELFKARKDRPWVKYGYHGTCRCDPLEEDVWDPICATDTMSYANPCEFEKSRKFSAKLRLRHRDLCRDFVEKKVLSGDDYTRLLKWQHIMPKDLFEKMIVKPISGNHGKIYDSPYKEIYEQKPIKVKEKKKRPQKKPT